MNELTILQTTQGLVRYAEANLPRLRDVGLVLAYDGRHHSRAFAEMTAAVFLTAGIPVHLFSRLTATPLVVRTCIKTYGEGPERENIG
jgi:phosphomannomutase